MNWLQGFYRSGASGHGAHLPRSRWSCPLSPAWAVGLGLMLSPRSLLSLGDFAGGSAESHGEGERERRGPWDFSGVLSLNKLL